MIMTIREYYKDYKNNSQYSVSMPSGFSATIEDFYKDCISKNNLDKANVLAWHKMFLEYVDRPDAIYWIRYYESGSGSYHKKYGRHDNRRACMTQFADGFSYVFVSNFDVHEIFNMIALGVTPDVDEFVEMMNHRTAVNSNYQSFPDSFPMHYDRGHSCEESEMNCYPNIGNPQSGVLTGEGWYLAHIVEIKSEYRRKSGVYKSLSKTERETIFPRGAISDWKPDARGIFVRYIDEILDDEYKEIVKAHFLRFVDPLNYYAVPGEKAQQNETPYAKSQKTIGEYDPLNMFMAQKFEMLYGKVEMDEFRKAALIDFPSDKQIMNITFHPASTKGRTGSSKRSGSGSGVGQYAKKFFTDLLNSGKLSAVQLSYLQDKSYCSKTFGISYPVIAENIPGAYKPERYYKNHVICGKYVICSQWTEPNKAKIDTWRTSNGF